VLPHTVDRQRIIVADEDSVVVAFIIDTLRADGHYVTHSYDALSATQDFALHDCHLLISSTRVDGAVGIDLIDELRERRPALPLLYLADVESTPELEAQLPADVPILREPFTAEQLHAAARPLLPQLRIGPTLALKGTSGESRGRKATVVAPCATLPSGAPLIAYSLGSHLGSRANVAAKGGPR
jgi:DNA-binding response OmpR family regulator